MNEPRAYTADEVRDEVLNYLHGLVEYWAKVKADPEALIARGITETQWRLSGLMHSTLAMIDGCAIALPAFDLIPQPAPEDREYHKRNGENWYESIVINDCYLHDLWGRKRP